MRYKLFEQACSFLLKKAELPGVARAHVPRFALGLSADFRTTPGLILFLLLSPFDCSDVVLSFRNFQAGHHWGFFSAGGGEGGHLFPTTGAGALIIFQILALVQIFQFSRTTLADEIWIDINLQSRPAPLMGRGSAL